MHMRRKMMLLAGVALCLLGVAQAQAPQAQQADHQFCAPFQREWQSLQNGGLDATSAFRIEVSNSRMCPLLLSAIDQRVSVLAREQSDRSALRQQLEAQSAQNRAAQTELTNLERTLRQETVARQRAEQDAADLRRIREAEEAAARIPGRPRNLIACSMAQDIARMERGNIPGVQFENLNVPPEIQVVYDIADVERGAIDVYGFDLVGRRWTRNRVAASRTGNSITAGGTYENEQNARLRALEVIDLDTMTTNGQGFFEPINSGAAPAINVNNGQANLNVGALFQQPPRLWLETRGYCAYQNGAPPGPLTGTPEWRVTAREIPTIPRMPRR